MGLFKFEEAIPGTGHIGGTRLVPDEKSIQALEARRLQDAQKRSRAGNVIGACKHAINNVIHRGALPGKKRLMPSNKPGK